MGFWSSLGSAISSFFSGISNALKNSPLLQTLLPILAVALPPPLDAIAVVAIQAIAATMGVEEKPDELGWQMNEADKKPEDFGSLKEYKEYLDREYPFDQGKFDALSEEQKTACRYIGMARMIQELKESKGFELTPESLGIIVRAGSNLKWGDTQIGDFLKGTSASLSNSGATSLVDVAALAKGTLAPDKQDAVTGAITVGAKEADVKQDTAAIIASLQESV